MPDTNPQIFGYKDLKINLAFSKASLTPYLGIEYSAMIQNQGGFSPFSDPIVHAQDVINELLPHLPQEGKKLQTLSHLLYRCAF